MNEIIFFEMKFFIVSSVILLIIGSTIGSDRINKYVTTHVKTSWEDTPIILEVAEYLNEEDSNLFWNFIDEVSNESSGSLIRGKLKERYDLAVSIAGMFLDTAELALLEWGLSLRIYSTKVEMYRQMARSKMMSRSNCDNFVDTGGEVACSLEELKQHLSRDTWRTVDTYNIDHFYLRKKSANRTVVFYGDICSDSFSDFHDELKSKAENDEINYVLRHHVRDAPNTTIHLSGYGVELQIKSTEYKATDDQDMEDNAKDSSMPTDPGFEEVDGIYFSALRQLYPEHLHKFDDLETYILENSYTISALKVWQFQDLSLQAAQKIMNSPPNKSIEILIDISQNFPSQTKSLVRTKFDPELRREMKLNQEMFSANLNIQPSESVLFINGLSFDVETVDVLSIINFLRSELHYMKSLRSIGFVNSDIQELLALHITRGSESQDYAIDIRDSAITWINDIESDSQYKHWSPSLTELLRPTFPGMIRNVRRNLYNLVIVMDPFDKKSQPLVALAESLYSYSVPLRLGFVLVTNPSVMGTTFNIDAAVNDMFYFVLESRGPKDALSLLSRLTDSIKTDDWSGDNLYKVMEDVRAQMRIPDGLASKSGYGNRSENFMRKKGLNKPPQVLVNGIPLPTDHFTSELLEDAVLSAIISQTPMIQRAVYRGDLSETDDVTKFLMSQPYVVPRFNDRILKANSHEWLDLMGTPPMNSDYRKWTLKDLTAWMVKQLKYISILREHGSNHLHTIWIVVDLSQRYGRRLLSETLNYLESNDAARVAIVMNPLDSSSSETDVNLIASAAIHALPAAEVIYYLRHLIQDSYVDQLMSGDFIIKDDRVSKEIHNQRIHSGVHKLFSKHVLGIGSGSRGIVYDGRLFGPLNHDEDFIGADYLLMEKVSNNMYGNEILKFLSNRRSSYNGKRGAEPISDDVIFKMISILVPRPDLRSRSAISFYGDVHSSVKIPARDHNAEVFDVVAIIDPVSQGAQKLGPIINVLQDTLNCDVRIFFNCIERNSDMPLRSFYRFVLERKLLFTTDGDILPPSARFTKLPTSPLLTQNIHAPENWLVEVVRSSYDLDNIKLDKVAVGVSSTFELEYLLLEGHCYETAAGNPPRGLQMILGTEEQSLVVDTIVMANLGYFQFKANPGEWILKLRPGRSSEIYDIISIHGSEVMKKEDSIKILISSLKSDVLKVRVKKKMDKVHMDLLTEDEGRSGIWDSITRSLTNSGEIEEDNQRLNIFSLASGHLYERFLRIMMLSVLKHTTSPVKFWFLKNYLSPLFKDFLPHMARKYGFEYEFVQYKWPRWLHQQVEKQRTIWGYKILFLDVLFPLNVKKIIFVDADQVVRADLKELLEVDLNGAPYAYPPFCESRREMDGFRFWKGGYWKNHLQGRSYHISALYVVDLKRFRRIAAGDRLRGQYQALSQDPNSLSNLDQDLPNNMIHQVAIKTLPQEWLWCETWCDDTSKKYAKTIDLCNNPLTKEAKLRAAMRILPEWKQYDEEIRYLQSELNRIRDQEEQEDDSQVFKSREHVEL